MGQKLRDSLAEQLRGNPKLLVYREIPLGPNVRGTQRADVLTLSKSYNVRVRIYEVKESRSDFNGDVNRGKYEGYFKSCHQLYWAVPRGLVRKDEVPARTGLIVYSEGKGWYVVKAPAVRSMDVTVDFLLACLFRGQEEQQSVRRLRERIILEENVQLRDRAKNLGWDIRQRLADKNPELEKAKGLIDEFLGKTHRDLSEAFWELKSFLIIDLPGLRNIVEARDLMTVVYELIHWPSRSLMSHGAFHRLAEFVDKRRGENGST